MIKNKWWLLISVGLIGIIIFFVATTVRLENQSDIEKIALQNKTWHLPFSQKLDEKTVNKKTVYVLNDQDEKVHVSINLSSDKKTIHVVPPENGYALNSLYYTLHVEKGIKSVIGRKLMKEKIIKFMVKDQLPVIGSKEKLNDYFEKNLKEQKRVGFFTRSVSEDTAESNSSENMKQDSGSNEFSETNIQVQGVDESDIVKTNGTYLFQVADGKVNIVDVRDKKEMKLISSLSYFEHFYPSQLFLEKDVLVVIGNEYENNGVQFKNLRKMDIMPTYEKTKAIIYDIRNPAKPKKVRSVALDGSMLSARKINSHIYLVTNHDPQYYLLREDHDVDIRPKYEDSTINRESNSVDYDKIQYFPDSKESNFTMIAAFDLFQPKQEVKVTTYLGSGDTMYMSSDHLYLALQNWKEEEEGGRNNSHVRTQFYKFSINGLRVNFEHSTEIDGEILNQFSMDEHNGFFRVAVTKGETWDERSPSDNHLIIFDSNLKKISSIENLARGERIYSARFMGDKVYIVTFRETDPLFVIDAADPSSPKVMGELKIPGFSNYLHPYDENHLIGFGHHTISVKEKESQEPLILTEGVKLSLFDVSDMKNPKEMFSEIIGGRGTYSSLNYDHKALLHVKKKNLFAFPITIYHGVKDDPFQQIFDYQGAYVYQVDLKKGFTFNMDVSHMKGKEIYEEWENEISRIVYIDESIFALSNSKITSHALEDKQILGELRLQ